MDSRVRMKRREQKLSIVDVIHEDTTPNAAGRAASRTASPSAATWESVVLDVRVSTRIHGATTSCSVETAEQANRTEQRFP
jgi:hypothetical protein